MLSVRKPKVSCLKLYSTDCFLEVVECAFIGLLFIYTTKGQFFACEVILCLQLYRGWVQWCQPAIYSMFTTQILLMICVVSVFSSAHQRQEITGYSYKCCSSSRVLENFLDLFSKPFFVLQIAAASFFLSVVTFGIRKLPWMICKCIKCSLPMMKVDFSSNHYATGHLKSWPWLVHGCCVGGSGQMRAFFGFPLTSML